MAGNANSGRKSKEEEFKAVKEKIRQECLIELANKVVYKRLKSLEDTDNPILEKDFALPITLKGIVDRKDITSGDKPLPILPLNAIFPDDSNNKNNSAQKED